ncbi:MAG: VWA domain-containing protein [Armatimonadetes bacterium]|nr:VWA domain-containing protein [Armatimonadota bacterium]
MILIASTLFLAQAGKPIINPGELRVTDTTSKTPVVCALKRTDVNATISGSGAEVVLVQTFVNPLDRPIEAVYTFPMPGDAAVHRMRIQVGDRITEGLVRKREEARQLYNAAIQSGQTAALLDQERPNIFTQTVGNIAPKATVKVEIRYVQSVKYDRGEFEFRFPMTVGPRFLGNAPDPGKIDPPRMRTGANISVNVRLNAGAPILGMESPVHQVKIQQADGGWRTVSLASQDEIPNRDFVLRYKVGDGSIQPTFNTHVDATRGGYFRVSLVPPTQPKLTQISAREFVFVIDQSGSQGGAPIEKSKALTLKMLKTLRPGDSFNVMGFANESVLLWKAPRPATAENIAEAEKWIAPIQANGGTQLFQAVKTAYEQPHDPAKLKIIVFNTDGFVGDEPNIIALVRKKSAEARLFTFGIGGGCNDALIHSMSLEGRGDDVIVNLNANLDEQVSKFADRMTTPVLTDINVKVDGVTATELTPSAIPDVFSGQPITVTGRYSGSGPGKVTISGRVNGQPWSRELDVNFPSQAEQPSVMALWARERVENLMVKRYERDLEQQDNKAVIADITDLGLDYGIVTEYTSFVAIDTRVVKLNGKTITVRVPVEMTDGVTFGEEKLQRGGQPKSKVRTTTANRATTTAGFGGGMGGGSMGGMVAPGKPMPATMQDAGPNSGLRAPIGPASESSKEASIIDAKLGKAFAKAKGPVDVEIRLVAIDSKLKAKLEALGLKIALFDKTLMMVIGTVDASKLRAIAALNGVEKIIPFKG